MKLAAWAPQWATDAGLPAPAKNETMLHYCDRIGVDYGQLMSGLTERTEVCARARFSSLLADACPEAWETHLREFILAHVRTPAQPTL